MRFQIESFILALRDIVVAAYDMLTGCRRRRYSYAITINAPKEVIGRLFVAADIIFEKPNIRIVTEPIAGIEGGALGRMTIAGKPGPAIATQRLELGPDTFRLRYLPELCVGTAQIGTDDIYLAKLETLPNGATRMYGARELTHRRPATRVTAPMGVRTGAWLMKTQAEIDAGTVAQQPVHPLLRQGLWLTAAIASFWWIAGWQDAAILVLLVLLHELGHAGAMVATGCGVRVITLIPFVGGMAVPRRGYDSEWQHGLVALMGPGFSLIPTASLLWLGQSAEWLLAAHAAMMFAFINGINLIPVAPLDGGVAFNAVLHAFDSRLARGIAWLGIGTGFGLAIYWQSVIVALVFGLGALQLIWQASFDVKAGRRPLTWSEAVVLITALLLMVAAYAWLIVEASRIEDALS